MENLYALSSLHLTHRTHSLKTRRMHLSQKLISPNLQSACLSFLLSHAAGKPIKALRIAELYEEEELYREASRFVLDNLGGWYVLFH